MKRFLLEVTAFLALQAVVAVGLEATYRHLLGSDHYMAAFDDKARRLERTPPPRLLLVGGSSLAFGVNSATLERDLGRRVVNLGLNAGLGLDQILNQAERELSPGDLVVLSPEYRLLERGRPFDPGTLWQLMALAPASVRDLAPGNVPQLLDAGLALPQQHLQALWEYALHGRPNSVYWRSGFNERGDFLGHLEFGTWKAGDQHVWIPPVDETADARDRLDRFARQARARGAFVLLDPPPIPGDDHDRQAAAIASLWQALSLRTGLPLAQDEPVRRSRFFDTAYHLTRKGRKERTARLLHDLQALESGPAPSRVASEP